MADLVLFPPILQTLALILDFPKCFGVSSWSGNIGNEIEIFPEEEEEEEEVLCSCVFQ